MPMVFVHKLAHASSALVPLVVVARQRQWVAQCLGIAVIVLGLARGAWAWQEVDELPRRVESGLTVLYDLQTGDDPVIRNLATDDRRLDLRIGDPAAVQRRNGQLRVIGSTVIRTEQPAARLINPLKRTGSLSIEVWIRPADSRQSGPARIVTVSRNPTERNLTLGQDGDKVEVRLRTTKTSTNGIPALVSKGNLAPDRWTHVVYTFDRSGRARLYIDGDLNADQAIGGDLSNWDGRMQLALANELSGDRPWQGAYRLVAIYDRDLTAEEVRQNFRAAMVVDPKTEKQFLAQANARRFELGIAPLLSKHCLECHDTTTHKGQLDLSRKASALAGGEGGPVIIPGKAADSPLWMLVEANDMPQNRPPLSSDEKLLLKQWLDAGATWSLDLIDQAVYAHGGDAHRVFVQRLTVAEYVATIRDTLGIDIADEARKLLPRDVRADGFSNTAYNLNVDLEHVQGFSELAGSIAERVDVRSLARKYTKSRELTDENITKVVEPVGRLLLRGPLTKEEVALYCGISTSVAAAGGDFDEAIRYILETMLHSPRLIYRIEDQRGDGSPRPLTDHEMASRLSYILWGGPPDQELLQAADKGQLNRAGVESQARRMLRDRRAVEQSLRFASQWLALDRLNNLQPDPERFPNWDKRLADDMRAESLTFFEEVVWKQNRPLSDLMNAQVTFITPRLAKHYGLPVEKSNNDKDSFRVDLSSVPSRGGLLTQGSILTVGGDDASMVTRGLFVMHELLRGVVHNPPPCVDTTPVPSKPGLTQRMVSQQRIDNKACTGCHAKFEPLAFGLERFDGLGSFHEKDEHGNQLRDDGSILFPGQERPVPYGSAKELMDLLAESERVRESFTWKVTQFALGRPLVAQDARGVTQIHRAAWQEGGTYPSLMIAIVTSDLGMSTRTEPIYP